MTCRFIHNDECSGSTLCCLQCRSCWWVPWEKKHLLATLGKLVGRAGGELNSICSGSESYQGSLHCIICSRARNSNITIPSLENLQGEIVILLSSLALNCSPSGVTANETKIINSETGGVRLIFMCQCNQHATSSCRKLKKELKASLKMQDGLLRYSYLASLFLWLRRFGLYSSVWILSSE